jgi:hypothetical protein
MSNGVSLQADIGSLGLSGLGAFTTILSAMSRDNVQPMAMLLLENLGSLFHVDGPYASRVPEVMTRVVSHPVGRLSLAVGWRRGDAISVFAETAGGQAITLLAISLVNIYEDDKHCGLVLSKLCTSLLPKSLPASSAVQLADIARLIANKAGPLSFGNVLAQQTYRVLSVYQQLQIRSPEDLLEIPSVESMTQLFKSLSYSRMEQHLIRISGSTGILYIAAIVLFMFPGCTMLTVESMVLQSNEDNRIIIEVCESLTQIQVEKRLDINQTLISTSVKPLDHHRIHEDGNRMSFLWDGWLSEALCLNLGRVGLIFTEELRGAFCEFMAQITPHLKLSDLGDTRSLGDDPPRYNKTFKELLGQHYQYKVVSTCQAICHYTPQHGVSNPVDCWKALLEVLERHLSNIVCSCGDCASSVPIWDKVGRSCPRSCVWQMIGSALSYGVSCCLFETRGVVTMDADFSRVLLSGRSVLRLLQSLGLETDADVNGAVIRSPSVVYADIINMAGKRREFSRPELGSSSRGSSIYPRVLGSFEIEPNGSFGFFISEGMFVYNETYYECLRGDSESSKNRPIAKPAAEISPFGISRLWEPLSLTVSVREGFEEILLRLNINVAGFYFNMSTSNVVVGLMCLDFAQGCEHDTDDALQKYYEVQVSVGSVGTASKTEGNINILTTRGNRQAQFLACGSSDPGRGLLLSRCCLNCGVRQALDGRYHSLIVT